ncbi:hypothetical protein [Mycolicibacterium neoaurum]|uniref:hypothetical protein n=1 Tax=Mycolicibacterium neoaurum TaxID=1795 RepID=UPI001F4CD7AD|nr:hypothetical protein [Mycolicibacterium neoaurum]
MSGALVAGTSGVAAFNLIQPTTAEQMSPTDVKVQEHDARLDKNEADIKATNDRVDQVEQKTDENTQAIGAVQERVTVVEKRAETASKPAGEVSQPASTPTSVQPRKTNPRLVTGLSAQERQDKFGTRIGWDCTYTLGDDIANVRVISMFQGYDCHAVGTEISSDIATVWNIK